MAPRNRHILVSGFFGEAEISIHKAPRGTDAVFFTNNPSIERTAQKAGWRTILKDDGDFALSSDVRVSSIQSKYVKFLQFRHDYPALAQADMTTYCDHRACVQDRQLVELFTRAEAGCALLVRNSPSPKALPKEITISKAQPRYAVAMDRTLEWITQLIRRQGIRNDLQIVNTGLMHTVDVPKMMPLYDEVYAAIVELGQPQCQIIWATLAQKYLADIQRVEWNDIDIPWGKAAVDRRAAVSA